MSRRRALRQAVPSAILALLLASGAGGCSRGGAGEMLETARLEEVQRNLPHARKLYREIIERYPESPEAAEAKQRLAALPESEEH